jgi:serine/threonine-protein kinase
MCAACLISGALGESDKIESLGEFGDHDLIDVIAQGGMGIVYRARQREPQREVALKTLHGAELRSAEARARFRAETRALASIQHPAILPLHQCGEQDGVPFFTMQLARGGSLEARLGDYAGEWRKIAKLMATVAEAVHHAHERGILHRDLKPANLLFDEADRVYVSDFGLARFADDTASGLTLAAAVLGTPHYLAPEIVARGARAATTVTDVWSLGVILYELLAQKRPFEAPSIAGVLRAIAEQEPPDPSRYRRDVPRDLDVIVRKAIAPNAAARYQTARELADDLRRWLAGRPIHARPVSRWERTRLWARRNPAVGVLSVSLLVALIGGGVALATAWHAARQAARELRENLYAADIHVAHRAATDGDITRAAALLDAWRPQSGAPDLREFAWDYLRARVHNET